MSLRIYRPLHGEQPDVPGSGLSVRNYNVTGWSRASDQLISQFQLLLALPTGQTSPHHFQPSTETLVQKMDDVVVSVLSLGGILLKDPEASAFFVSG